MPNITISLEEDLLKSGRRYAERHRLSINALIRKLLEQAIGSDSNDWMEDCFRVMDAVKANSEGRTWKREDLYDV